MQFGEKEHVNNFFLGGAIAIDLCIKEEYATKIWCLVVENTFTSIPDMAKVLLRWRLLQYIPLSFYKNKVNYEILINKLLIVLYF